MSKLPEPGTYIGFRVVYNEDRGRTIDRSLNRWWWSSNVTFFKMEPKITDIRTMRDPGILRP